ncbi:MAG: hypothetical protein VX464_11565 [Pseudomonadota bacterium]|nr:hypothetical protein [Pseudomonadota bacterium]
MKSWSAGRNGTPDQVLAEMAALYARIEEAADVASDLIDAQDVAGEIELGIASDDHEAQSLGWPCVGAHRAVLAIVVARAIEAGHSVKIVPRGSTIATAAAADRHQK